MCVPRKVDVEDRSTVARAQLHRLDNGICDSITYDSPCTWQVVQSTYQPYDVESQKYERLWCFGYHTVHIGVLRVTPLQSNVWYIASFLHQTGLWHISVKTQFEVKTELLCDTRHAPD